MCTCSCELSLLFQPASSALVSSSDILLVVNGDCHEAMDLMGLIRAGRGCLLRPMRSKVNSLLWMLSSFISNSSINLN